MPFPDIERLVQDTERRAMAELANKAQNAARDYSTRGRPQNSPMPYLFRRTGTLQGSLNARVVGDSVALGSTVKYARIHELGGVIRGRPYLAFRLPSGQFVRVRSVTIPKRPFLDPAARDVMAQWDSIADHAFEEAKHHA